MHFRINNEKLKKKKETKNLPICTAIVLFTEISGPEMRNKNTKTIFFFFERKKKLLILKSNA